MGKKLFLIRHGLAVDREVFVGPDAERYLTAKGEQKTRRVAERLDQLNCRFDQLQTSPLVRAQQTAQIITAAGLAPMATVVDFLAPLGAFGDGLASLQAWQQSNLTDRGALAWVGHEPDLSQWAELLLWGEARGVITLKKAGLIGLSLPGDSHQDPVGNCQLFWLTAPGLLLA